jgi:diguanylate cyclase (GGDEF)-like protein
MSLSFTSLLKHRWRSLQLSLRLAGLSLKALGGLVWTRGVREQTQARQALIERRAQFDELTGLPNEFHCLRATQAAIDAAADQAYAQGHGEDSSVALLMLELSRAKQINDVLGQALGDLLLQHVGQLLTQQAQQNLRVQDAPLIARTGRSGFAILLKQGDAMLATALAQRIQLAFDRPLLVGEHKLQTGVFVGMACWPTHARDAAGLHRAATLALAASQQAKGEDAGPVLFNPSNAATHSRGLQLLTDLRRAVSHGQLQLHLQPQAALDTGAVVGAQLQVRWHHPQHGVLLPADFMPLASETELAGAVNFWAFEEAARLWQQLHNQGLTLMLSMPFMMSDLADTELPQKLDALLVRHRAPAEAFCLQLSEQSLMHAPVQARTMLDRLSALGFKLAVDDFGSGYSSLAALKHLPLDELKLTAAFVQNMQADVDDATIVRATIALAHNLGLSVLADGVETPKAWDMLRDLNCDAAQGSHLGPALPAEEFKLWCGAWVARQRPATAVSSIMLH